MTTVVLFQMFYLLNCRSLRHSIRSIGWASNPAVFIGIGVLAALLSAVPAAARARAQADRRR